MKSPLPFFVALALLGGCFTLPTGPLPDLSTPYKTLKLLRDSYSNLDYGGVDYVLNRNFGGFLFIFDPDDDKDSVVNGFTIPFDWGRDQELIATQHMFDDAERILIDLNLEGMQPPPEGARHYSSNWLSYTIIYYSISQDDSFIVNGNAQFELEKQGEDWIITRWVDEKVGEHSWGWLKAWYRL
ncbi:MAG: hypothetical protein NTW26_05350 [bacterium]|nr:hypothetical protein [bacterium]